jgi:hypothetical protein
MAREHELKDRLKDCIDERNESPHFYLSLSQEMKYVLYNIVGISVRANGLVITFIAEVVPHHSALVGLSFYFQLYFFWYRSYVSKRHVHNFGNLPRGFILLVKLDYILFSFFPGILPTDTFTPVLVAKPANLIELSSGDIVSETIQILIPLSVCKLNRRQ